MITRDTYKLKISEDEALKKVAYADKDTFYDKEKKELVFKINNATDTNFYLIYKNKKVLALIEGTNETVISTIHIMEEFNTKQEALDRVLVLELKYEPQDFEIDDTPIKKDVIVKEYVYGK